MSDNLGDRMKSYEDVWRQKLVRRMPVILRVDGKAFHTFTAKYCKKPYDAIFQTAMISAAEEVFQRVQGITFCFIQSDEASFLLQDYARLNTEAPFDYNIQKLSSIAASIMSVKFNSSFEILYNAHNPQLPIRQYGTNEIFDARLFNLPKEEVVNYFIWRQQDAVRNSILSLGYANFSHKYLLNKNINEVQDILMKEKGINWNDVVTKFKRGMCIYKLPLLRAHNICEEIPIFTQDRNFIERFIHIDKVVYDEHKI